MSNEGRFESTHHLYVQKRNFFNTRWAPSL